jgi:hypothetical protein
MSGRTFQPSTYGSPKVLQQNVLTNREIAALFWLTIFVTYAAVKNKDVGSSFIHLVRALGRFKILLPLLLFAANVAGSAWLASLIGLWECSLLKETVIWFVLSGTALLFRSMNASTDEDFFRRTVLDTVGISVFLEFFMNVTSFSLGIELVLQPFLALLVMMNAFASHQEQYAPVRKPIGVFLFFVLISLIVATALEIHQNWSDLDPGQLFRSFGLSIWLTIAALPFMYLFALFAGYELAFMRMGFANNRNPLSATSRLALLVGLNGRIRDVHALTGKWAGDIAKAPTFGLALQRVRNYRRNRSRRAAEEQEQRDRLVRFAGVDGIDAEGRRLDQREFTETKRALQ